MMKQSTRVRISDSSFSIGRELWILFQNGCYLHARAHQMGPFADSYFRQLVFHCFGNSVGAPQEDSPIFSSLNHFVVRELIMKSQY